MSKIDYLLEEIDKISLMELKVILKSGTFFDEVTVEQLIKILDLATISQKGKILKHLMLACDKRPNLVDVCMNIAKDSIHHQWIMNNDLVLKLVLCLEKSVMKTILALKTDKSPFEIIIQVFNNQIESQSTKVETNIIFNNFIGTLKVIRKDALDAFCEVIKENNIDLFEKENILNSIKHNKAAYEQVRKVAESKGIAALPDKTLLQCLRDRSQNIRPLFFDWKSVTQEYVRRLDEESKGNRDPFFINNLFSEKLISKFEIRKDFPRIWQQIEKFYPNYVAEQYALNGKLDLLKNVLIGLNPEKVKAKYVTYSIALSTLKVTVDKLKERKAEIAKTQANDYTNRFNNLFLELKGSPIPDTVKDTIIQEILTHPLKPGSFSPFITSQASPVIVHYVCQMSSVKKHHLVMAMSEAKKKLVDENGFIKGRMNFPDPFGKVVDTNASDILLLEEFLNKTKFVETKEITKIKGSLKAYAEIMNTILLESLANKDEVLQKKAVEVGLRFLRFVFSSTYFNDIQNEFSIFLSNLPFLYLLEKHTKIDLIPYLNCLDGFNVAKTVSYLLRLYSPQMPITKLPSKMIKACLDNLSNKKVTIDMLRGLNFTFGALNSIVPFETVDKWMKKKDTDIMCSEYPTNSIKMINGSEFYLNDRKVLVPPKAYEIRDNFKAYETIFDTSSESFKTLVFWTRDYLASYKKYSKEKSDLARALISLIGLFKSFNIANIHPTDECVRKIGTNLKNSPQNFEISMSLTKELAQTYIELTNEQYQKSLFQDVNVLNEAIQYCKRFYIPMSDNEKPRSIPKSEIACHISVNVNISLTAAQKIMVAREYQRIKNQRELDTSKVKNDGDRLNVDMERAKIDAIEGRNPSIPKQNDIKYHNLTVDEKPLKYIYEDFVQTFFSLKHARFDECCSETANTVFKISTLSDAQIIQPNTLIDDTIVSIFSTKSEYTLSKSLRLSKEGTYRVAKAINENCNKESFKSNSSAYCIMFYKIYYIIFHSLDYDNFDITHPFFKTLSLQLNQSVLLDDLSHFSPKMIEYFQMAALQLDLAPVFVQNIIKQSMDYRNGGFPLNDSTLDFISKIAKKSKDISVARQIAADVVAYVNLQSMFGLSPTHIEEVLKILASCHKTNKDYISIFIMQMMVDIRSTLERIPALHELNSHNPTGFNKKCKVPKEGKFNEFYDRLVSDFVCSSLMSRKPVVVDATNAALSLLELSGKMSDIIEPIITKGMQSFSIGSTLSFTEFSVAFLINPENAKYKDCFEAFLGIFEKLRLESSQILKSLDPAEYAGITKLSSVKSLDSVYSAIDNVFVRNIREMKKASPEVSKRMCHVATEILSRMKANPPAIPVSSFVPLMNDMEFATTQGFADSIKTFNSFGEFAKSCASFGRKTTLMEVIFNIIYKVDFKLKELRAISEAKFGISSSTESSAAEMFHPKVMLALKTLEPNDVAPLISGLGAILFFSSNETSTSQSKPRKKRISSDQGTIMRDLSCAFDDCSCSFSDSDEQYS